MPITLLTAQFIGVISVSLVSAILLRIPGTLSSVTTCFEGHPMVNKGQAAKALGIGAVFLIVTLLVIVSYVTKPLRLKRKAAKAA